MLNLAWTWQAFGKGGGYPLGGAVASSKCRLELCGGNAWRNLQEAFPQLDIAALVPRDKMERFASSRGGAFPPPQHCEGLASVLAPVGEAGDAEPGNAAAKLRIQPRQRRVLFRVTWDDRRSLRCQGNLTFLGIAMSAFCLPSFCSASSSCARHGMGCPEPRDKSATPPLPSPIPIGRPCSSVGRQGLAWWRLQLDRRDHLQLDRREQPAGRRCGVVLLGDAAHSFPPDIGQGVNSALQDVAVLHAALRDAADDIGQALSLFERRRLPDVRALAKLAQVGRVGQMRRRRCRCAAAGGGQAAESRGERESRHGWGETTCHTEA
jgi:FAD binding domain